MEFAFGNMHGTLDAKLVIGYQLKNNPKRFEKELSFSSGEELENYVFEIAKKNFNVIFQERDSLIDEICKVWLIGLRLEGVNDDARMDLLLTDDRKECLVQVEVLKKTPELNMI